MYQQRDIIAPPDDLDIDRLVDGQSKSAADAADDRNPLIQNWIPQTLADARKPRPPQEWIVWKLLPKSSLSIFYGAPGHLKSMILLDLACCVAGGLPWLEPLPGRATTTPEAIQTTRCAVLWVDFDNGSRITGERMQAFADTYGLASDVALHYLTMPTPFLDSSSASMILDLIRYIEKGGYALVIIDNLGLIKGAVEENSAEMTEVMKYQRLVAERTNAAVILVHHQRKSSTTGNDGGTRKGESLRGHSSIEAACDLVIHVQRADGSNNITLTPTKARGSLPFVARSAVFTFENDTETESMLRGRFFGWGEEKPMDTWNKQITNTIRDVATSMPGITMQSAIKEVQERMSLMEGVRVPGITFLRGRIKQMAQNGEIDLREGAKVGRQTETRLYINA